MKQVQKRQPKDQHKTSKQDAKQYEGDRSAAKGKPNEEAKKSAHRPQQEENIRNQSKA